MSALGCDAQPLALETTISTDAVALLVAKTQEVRCAVVTELCSATVEPRGPSVIALDPIGDLELEPEVHEGIRVVVRSRELQPSDGMPWVPFVPFARGVVAPQNLVQVLVPLVRLLAGSSKPRACGPTVGWRSAQSLV